MHGFNDKAKSNERIFKLSIWPYTGRILLGLLLVSVLYWIAIWDLEPVILGILCIPVLYGCYLLFTVFKYRYETTFIVTTKDFHYRKKFLWNFYANDPIPIRQVDPKPRQVGLHGLLKLIGIDYGVISIHIMRGDHEDKETLKNLIVDNPMEFARAISAAKHPPSKTYSEAQKSKTSSTKSNSKPSTSELNETESSLHNSVTESFGVAKVPFYPKNSFEKLVGGLRGFEEHNFGPSVWHGYSVNHIYFFDDFVYTSCDCNLAINIWDKNTKRIHHRIQGSDASLTTTVFIMTDDEKHLIFGNGVVLFYSYSLSNPVRLEMDITAIQLDSLCFVGQRIFWKSDDYKRLFYCEIRNLPQLVVNEVRTFSTLDFGGITPIDLKIRYLREWNGTNYIFMHSEPNPHCDGDIWFYVLDYESFSIQQGFSASDIQSVSVEIRRRHICILGRELVVLDENFKVIHSSPPPSRLKEWQYNYEGNIEMSPASNRLVFSSPYYSGLYMLDLEKNATSRFPHHSTNELVCALLWSKTGKFLACISRQNHSKSGMFLFTVYNAMNGAIIQSWEADCFSNGKVFQWKWLNEQSDSETLIYLNNKQTVTLIPF